MAYDDERPADWTSYDNVATASDNLRFLLNMRGIPEQLRLVLGPENFVRAIELLDCIDKRLKEMGNLGVSWAASLMAERAHDGDDMARLLKLNDARRDQNINKAWNIAERWAKGVPEGEDDV